MIFQTRTMRIQWAIFGPKVSIWHHRRQNVFYAFWDRANLDWFFTKSSTGPLGSIYNFLSRHFCKNWCVIWKFNWHSFEPLYISSWMILKWFLIYGLISYKWPLIAKGLILAVPTCIWKWIYNNLSLNFLPQFGSFLVKIHFCIIFRKIDALRGCWGQILFM